MTTLFSTVGSSLLHSLPPLSLSLPPLLLAFLFSWLLIHKWNHRHSPGPPSWPILGSSLSLALRSHAIHDYLTGYFKMYPTFKVSYPGFDHFYTADPRNVEHMVKTKFSTYLKGEFNYDVLRDLFGDGFVNVDGEAWKQQRQVGSLEFTSISLRDLSVSVFRDYAVKLAKLLVHEAKAQRSFEMQDGVKRMTLESICKISFGVEMGNLEVDNDPENLEFARAFDSSFNVIFWRFMNPLWKLQRLLGWGTEAQLVKDIATIDAYLYRVVNSRRDDIKQIGDGSNLKPDLLSRFLVRSLKKSGEFTDTKLRDITLSFMTAGRDTTSLTLCWFLYMLIENPQVEEKVLQELFEVDGDTEEDEDNREEGGFPSETRMRKFAELLTCEKLSKMDYLHACLAETLRLYPPVPMDSRCAASNDRLPDGTLLRKGDALAYNGYSMGRMERLWGKDAEEFKPERFLRGGKFQPESPFKHVAFHGGPRMCLGKDFAYLQMKVTAAVLLRFLKFDLVPGQKVRYRLSLMLYQEGLKVNVSPRTKGMSSRT